MKPFLKIRIIFATAIGYMLGVLLLIPILIFIMVQSTIGKPHLFNKGLKFICRMILLCFGIWIKRSGHVNISADKPHIFIANHVNLFDLFILYGYIPGYARGVELDSHFSWPVWGVITKRLGTIPISHTNTKAALKSLKAAENAYKSGTSIIILPEGRRTRDGELGLFNRGPFRLAKQTGSDIIPVAMKGAWERKTVFSLIVTPGIVELKFGDVIPQSTIETSSERQLKELAKERIQELLTMK